MVITHRNEIEKLKNNLGISYEALGYCIGYTRAYTCNCIRGIMKGSKQFWEEIIAFFYRCNNIENKEEAPEILYEDYKKR